MKTTILFLLALIAVAIAVDYCNTNLCDDGYVHIACENNGDWVSTCHNPVQITLTPDQKKIIIDQHNGIRDNVASGAHPSLPTAAHMQQIQWESELAYLAELGTKQCSNKPDVCHNTEEYRWCGQNTYVQCTSGLLNVDQFLKDSVNSWIAKAEALAPNDVLAFESVDPSAGVFTQLIQEKTSRIGCAASTYTAPRNRKMTCTLLVCNYNYVNILNEPVYSVGLPGSSCSTGTSTNYKNLCSPDEYIEPEPSK